MTASTPVGVDVGGTAVKAVRLGPDGSPGERFTMATPPSSDGIVATIGDVVERLGPADAVGVALAGLVDGGRLAWGPHLPYPNLAVASLLRERLGVAVTVGNDADMAARAELERGAAKGSANAVVVTVGTGIGCGIVLDGAVRRGRGYAGEAGHMTADPTGPPCVCGRRGCWEVMVSGRRLDLEAGRLLGSGATATDLVAAAEAGDPAALEVVRSVGEWLAWGVETLVLVLDPDLVVVGGAVATAGDLLLEPVRRRLALTEGADYRAPTPVVAGILGGYAGAIGAAIVAAEGNVGP